MQQNNENTDLPDSAKDKKQMQQESSTFDLPEVKDIPGQENIKPAPMGDLADDTISSSDEEGDTVFDDNIDESIEESNSSNVSEEEKNDLEVSAQDMPTEDDINLRKAALDNTDNDGVLLNESSFKDNISGTGLDVPGAENDDANEAIGEEDEENNEYSLGGDKND